VAFQRQRHLLGHHPATIVGHFYAAQPAFGQPHRDRARARINRVFDQFFQRRSGAFDHLAGGNAVNQRIGQAADDGHGLTHTRISARGRP